MKTSVLCSTVALFYTCMLPPVRGIADDRLIDGAVQFEQKAREKFAENARQIEDLQNELEAMEAGRINKNLKAPQQVKENRAGKRFVWKSTEAKQAAMEAIKLKIANLSDLDSVYPSLFFNNLKPGDAGRLPKYSPNGFATYNFRVFQVVDENNVIISWERYGSTAVVGGFSNTRGQLLQNTSSTPGSQMQFWLVGPTDGMVDDQVFKTASPLQVIGTEQYITPFGTTATVPKLKIFDVSNLVDELLGAKDGKDNDLADSPEAREWSDASGRFKVKAKMISSDDEHVTLEKESGETVKVRIDQLSERDRQHLRTP